MKDLRRIVLDEAALEALCKGEVVEQDDVAVMMADIGFERIILAARSGVRGLIAHGLSEVARLARWDR